MKEDNSYDLSGKSALVTGGSKGIGHYLATLLSQNGAAVAVASRHLEEAEAAAKEIRQGGGKAVSLYADISRVETLAPMVEQTVARLGKIDILVNNAGTNVRKPAIDFTEGEWDQVLDTNLKGTFFCAQAAARQMIRQGGGRIINVSSAAGGRPVPWLTPYSISKAGINHMTRALAVEWGRYKITVNGIAPSYMETPLTRAWLSDPKRYDKIAKRSPLGRIGRIQDLAGAVLLFASSASDFITGQTLFVDGGGGAGWAVDWEEESKSS
jgi:NAD(P)-dependent dehydrogenase (short-subunit alcohol dehydrogenase family)